MLLSGANIHPSPQSPRGVLGSRGRLFPPWKLVEFPETIRKCLGGLRRCGGVGHAAVWDLLRGFENEPSYGFRNEPCGLFGTREGRHVASRRMTDTSAR